RALVALVWRGREPGKQGLHDFRRLFHARLDGVARGTVLELGPRQRNTAGDDTGAQRLQPVAKQGCRDAVLAVVTLDGGDVRLEVGHAENRLAELDRPLDGTPRRRRLAQVLLALVPVELLELLDRVALDAG